MPNASFFRWRDTSVTSPRKLGYFEELLGDKNAIPRDWWQRWRKQWRWHLFKVDVDPDDEELQKYFVFYASGTKKQKTTFVVETPYFFARLGPDTTRFWAAVVSRDGHVEQLPIEHIDAFQENGWVFDCEDDRQHLLTRDEACDRGLAVSI